MSAIEATPESLAWTQVATWLFFVGWSLIGAFVAKSLNKLADAADRMKEAVAELSKNVAVVVEKVNGHERRIERLEENE